MKLVIFSICHNEEATIAELIERIPTSVPGVDEIEVFVLDDGSKDNTAAVARSKGVEVYSNGMQKRLAYSFQRAVDIALRKGADIVVNIDGDLQYSPEEIPVLAQPVIEGKVDFAAADRFTDGTGKKRKKPENMPVGNYLGNLLGSFVISKLSGKSFSDVTSGFRAYNRKALLAININGKFTYTQETFQLLAIKNMGIVHVPVSIKYFEGRKSRVVSSISKFITNSAVNIIRSFRDFSPLAFFGYSGLVTIFIGLVFIGVLMTHYLSTGQFTPYKFLGFVGIFFISLGLVVWIVGLVGDMLDRVLSNQEKIIQLLKEVKYSEINNNSDNDSSKQSGKVLS